MTYSKIHIYQVRSLVCNLLDKPSQDAYQKLKPPGTQRYTDSDELITIGDLFKAIYFLN